MSISSLYESPQILQVYVLIPLLVHVALFVISETYTCPKASIIFCSEIIDPHVEQWLPSVRPDLVQVASIELSVISV